MITDSNQVYLAKMTGRRVQEVLLFFAKSNRSGIQFNASTYLSAIEVYFRVRRFPIEIIMPGRSHNLDSQWAYQWLLVFLVTKRKEPTIEEQ
jgi:hypothetical protein